MYKLKQTKGCFLVKIKIKTRFYYSESGRKKDFPQKKLIIDNKRVSSEVFLFIILIIFFLSAAT